MSSKPRFNIPDDFGKSPAVVAPAPVRFPSGPLPVYCIAGIKKTVVVTWDDGPLLTVSRAYAEWRGPALRWEEATGRMWKTLQTADPSWPWFKKFQEFARVTPSAIVTGLNGGLIMQFQRHETLPIYCVVPTNRLGVLATQHQGPVLTIDRSVASSLARSVKGHVMEWNDAWPMVNFPLQHVSDAPVPWLADLRKELAEPTAAN